MRKLKTDYLDLVLIHQCLSDYYGAYHALESLYDEGKIRTIGVSNFSAERMADIATFNRIAPAVNQVETHLFWQQYNLHEWMVKYNIQHEAWGPLAQHRLKEVLENPVVKQIADAHGKTPAQVALRQHIQRGIVVIPKSVHKERMKQNMDIFDFKLSEQDMASISKLDAKESLFFAHQTPEAVDMFVSMIGERRKTEEK